MASRSLVRGDLIKSANKRLMNKLLVKLFLLRALSPSSLWVGASKSKSSALSAARSLIALHLLQHLAALALAHHHR
jgi:hypothetical protein